MFPHATDLDLIEFEFEAHQSKANITCCDYTYILHKGYLNNNAEGLKLGTHYSWAQKEIFSLYYTIPKSILKSQNNNRQNHINIIYTFHQKTS